MILWRICALVIGYAFGLIQTGFFIGKSQNIDLRTMGSKSSGSTNALRILGKKAGILTFIGDFLKGIVAVIICMLLFGSRNEDATLVYALYGGLGVVIGHCYPFYLKCKGGKGVASTLGILLLLDWRLVLIPLVVFLIVVILTKYVSLGSIISFAIVIMESYLFSVMGVMKVGEPYLLETCILFTLLCGLGIYRHKENIKRLLKDEENKIHL